MTNLSLKLAIAITVLLTLTLCIQSCSFFDEDEDKEATCIDLDQDTICDNEDDDIDGDFLKNQLDPYPSDRFKCGDMDQDGCDDCQSLGYANPQFDGCPPPVLPQALPLLEYMAHFKDFGDKGYATQPQPIGTEGQGRQLEGFSIRLASGGKIKLRYKAHLQDLGNTDWVFLNDFCGTRKQKRRLEAFWIEIIGDSDKEKYSVVYTSYAQSRGWMPWAKDGAMSGSIGEQRRLEDIRIMIIPK